MRPLRQIANRRRIVDFLLGLLGRRGHLALCLPFAFSIVAAGELHAQGFLIPDTTRRDMVFDFAGQNLYISTSTGLIKTFHVSSRTFGTTYNLGGSLNGIDIARNDSFILAAQNNIGASQGTFQKVNLATGMITNINYARAFGEEGAWDVAIGSNGLALATTQFGGSGWTPLRQIDLSNNAITIRTDAPGSGGPGQVSAPTQIHRSADGARFFFMEGNISSGPLFTYSAITNTFGPRFEGNGYLDSASGAVNRNGHLIALRQNGPTAASLNTAPDFNFLHSFNELDSGVAFDAVHNILYGVNSETDEIIAYNTNTFAELFRLPIGEDIPTVPPATQFHAGTLVASADGRWIALETDSGIRLFQVAGSPIPTPTPSTTPTPTPSPTPASQLGNISTRAFVQTGDNVMIGGFIVQGTGVKRVIIRAIGPELGAPPYNIANALANPTLELHDGTGALIASNDNWQHTIIGGIITSDQRGDIRNSGYAPGDGRESAIIADLAAGNYTAIVRGVDNMTGVALVEVYDLNLDATSILHNISTRAFVQTDDNVMIGGFIIQGTQPKRVILRAIGPELSQYGVPNVLPDPTVELHDSTGTLIASNDNWQHTIIGGIIATDQVKDIRSSGLAPGQLSESAIIATLPPGNYTAIVRGKNIIVGVALVEVYDLENTTFDVLATVPLPMNAQYGVAVNPALNKIYASGGASGGQRVVVIDGSTFAASNIGSGSGVSVDTNTSRYWTTNVYGGAALARDGSTNHLLATVPLGFCPIDTTYDSNRNRVWVGAQCGAENDPVFAIDATTFNVVAGPIGSGGVMGPVIANGATGRLYLTASGVSERVDPTTFAVTTNAFGTVMAVNAVTDKLYATNGNDLQIINGATNPEKILTTIALPYGPASMGVNTVRNHLYLANPTGRSIEVRNGSTGALIATFFLASFGAIPNLPMAVDSTRGRIYIIASSASGPELFVIKDLTTD